MTRTRPRRSPTPWRPCSSTTPRPTTPPELSLELEDPATVPGSFSTPDLRFAIGLGLLLAFGLAAAAAVVRDLRTHTVDDAASVEDAATAPLLAHLSPPGDLTSMPAIAPGTAEADLFRHLRLALEAQADAGAPRVVVAAVAAGDVNVWVGANVALALAGTGRRVLLVDGRMGERFGTPAEGAPDTPGLYDVLLGATSRPPSAPARSTCSRCCRPAPTAPPRSPTCSPSGSRS